MKKKVLIFVICIFPELIWAQKSDNLIRARQTIQGKWMREDNHLKTILLTKNKIFYLTANRIQDSATFEVARETKLNGSSIIANEPELLFITTRRQLKEVYYLTGYNKSEFDIMALNNAQTLIYRKIKK